MATDIYTSEKLRAEKAQLQKELKQCARRISQHWAALTAPPEETTKFRGWVNQAERAYVVYDGVMTGYKLMKRFNRFAELFKKKPKKKQ